MWTRAGGRFAVLATGAKFPLLGVGTYQMRDPAILAEVIDAALSEGYRLIDTAAVYRNEDTIGEALREFCPKHGLKPEDVFITSKLAPRDHGYESTLAACDQSLKALGRPYLDLYLIHWPGVQGKKGGDPQIAVLRRETWRAMEELTKRGKVKAIGVSNYTVKHLEELMEYATIRPSVLQSECHPQLRQKEVRSYCAAHGIVFQAYSSLGRGQLLSSDAVRGVASRRGKTPSQVLLRWAVQQGMAVIPKASTAARVRENADTFDFELSTEDVHVLDSLDQNCHYCWNPDDIT